MLVPALKNFYSAFIRARIVDDERRGSEEELCDGVVAILELRERKFV